MAIEKKHYQLINILYFKDINDLEKSYTGKIQLTISK